MVRLIQIMAITLSMLAAIHLAQPVWKVVDPTYQWAFPDDHWAHPEYRTEWWYFTGHLKSENSPHRSFGYQFTIFRIGLTPTSIELNSDWSVNQMIMGHLAISDFQTGDHLFSEVLYRESDVLGRFGIFPDSCIARTVAPIGSKGTWTLHWNGSAFDLTAKDDRTAIGLHLETRPEKDLVFQGPNGYSAKSREQGKASLYYSFTRLATIGTLSLGRQQFQVRGQSWMDKEISSSLLSTNQVGWDWFSLQFDSGEDLMLFQLRNNRNETDFSSGTLVHPDGRSTYLNQSDFSLSPLERWTSRESDAVYPVRWRVVLANWGKELEIVPAMLDQENRSKLVPGMNYWEGSVKVLDGNSQIGVGYLEMTGYGENAKLPL